MRYCADVETNGLVPSLSKVHSLVLRDRDTGAIVASCTDEGAKKFPKKYQPIQYGLQLLSVAEAIYFHNGVAFDIPALKKVYPKWTYTGRVLDTLVLVRSRFAHQKEMDWNLVRKGVLPPKMIGKHSLEAWGYRLGCKKDEYSGGWEQWSTTMQDYCEQDTETLLAIVNHIQKIGMPKEQAETEMELAWYLAAQEREGWFFDVSAATALHSKLCGLRSAAEQKLIDLFGSWQVSTGLFTPKRDDAKRGYQKGVTIERFKTVQFNPSSRKHLAYCLKKKYNWKPVDFTETGDPKVDEDVLAGLVALPGIKDVMDYLVLDKRIGLLSGSGKRASGWLGVVTPEGKIYGSINQSGAVTHRGTHRTIANVPRVTTPYGKELRALFYTPTKIGGKPWVQMGADASGLELRCLAHYIAKYDNGVYVKLLLEGDPHSQTQEALGLMPFGKKGRDVAKTWTYAWLYGAGDEKLGLILSELRCPGASSEKLAALGKKSRAGFLKKIPALGYVVDAVQHAAKTKGYVRLIDGRRALCRAEHSALNTLLQGTGAVIFKRAIVEFARTMRQKYGEPGWSRQWSPLIWYHDEIQVALLKSIAEDAQRIVVASIESITERYSFRCPLTGEAKLGNNWAECH